MNLRKNVTDVGTGIALVCAIAMTTVAFADRFRTSEASSSVEIVRWEQYSLRGHRLGASNAPVTIVEWGDYQCPACRRWASVLDSIRVEFGENVAIVYRHWPLDQHVNAYPAARAAECAAEQGKFEQYHRALYADGSWGWNPQAAFVDLAREVGIESMESFQMCIADVDPQPAVEADIDAVLELGGAGTPTLLLNNILYVGSPDPVVFRNEIRRMLHFQK